MPALRSNVHFRSGLVTYGPVWSEMTKRVTRSTGAQTMNGRRFIRTIRLENLLSYGPDTEEIDLLPLNVLIGPNGSGKSNLIEALSLLQAAPRNLQRPIQVGGGTREWLWKGIDRFPTAVLEVTIENKTPIKYHMSFTAEGPGRFVLKDERVEDSTSLRDSEKINFYYRYQEGSPVLNANVPTKRGNSHKWQKRKLKRKLSHEQSILSQIRDPDVYPILAFITDRLSPGIHFYRDWDFGRYRAGRHPIPIDQPSFYLSEDASNLSLVLGNLINKPIVRDKILDEFRLFFPQTDFISSTIQEGSIRIDLQEKGLQHPISLSRFSDGMLRYISLLTILCHPDPPLVTCIEEPEMGLHPDIIIELARLLIEASSKSQIIITTHSDILVDALTDIPEAIIVCERPTTSTQMSRLDKDKLEPWLKKYRLGDLWTSGQLGGNRW